MLLIFGAIYFPSKKSKANRVLIGKTHLDNMDKLDDFSRSVIENWVSELKSEIGEDKLDDQKLWQIIGLKIKNEKHNEDFDGEFKPLTKAFIKGQIN